MGPLAGIKVVEFAGIGPGPFAGMMLADIGAEVVQVTRQGWHEGHDDLVDARGRKAMCLDLRDAAAKDACLALCDHADLVFEGYRPGVMERLGLGPEVMLARNPALVYGRMTGWGQAGPYSAAAGHDINYLSLSGALHAIGTEDKPLAPLNLGADYAGGALFLVIGMLAALTSARSTGRGQVVDAAMTDGTAYLMSIFYGMFASGDWEDKRRQNALDGGAPFYDTYRCADDEWISIGSLEPQFFSLLVDTIGAPPELKARQHDRHGWDEVRSLFQSIFAQRTRDEWCEIMGGTDICFAPVLSLGDAPNHPHNVSRGTFVAFEGRVQPAPAPRFSATGSTVRPRVELKAGQLPLELDGWALPDGVVASLASVLLEVRD